jgi:butyryl-CoA dehydrogenase
MTAKFVSKRNVAFLLYDVLDAEQLIDHPYYADHSRKTFDMVTDAATKLAQKLLLPTLEEMDRNPPILVDGKVKVHPSVSTLLSECGEGGWIASSFPVEHGGEQLPVIMSVLVRYIFSAANYSASVYPALCSGAAHLITSFGSQDLIDTYVPKMLDGKWQGTMALTEPQAGSSLTDITTTAFPAKDGSYRIQGQKIFISAGDHDGTENVIHLMLAKIEGAPAGIKGISLFVVPRHRVSGDGVLKPNDITVSQIYHKLGYRGSPITELSIGENNDCHGYLVGEPHRGLTYMFQMMNEARIDVGVAATGIAAAAYYAALDYARQRPQGRKLTAKDPALPQIPIIEHADVKRMLLFQRAVVEGSLALILQCCLYDDLRNVSTGEEQDKFGLMLDILTPVAKSYPSEMGILAVSQALQCFGGYGYCEDFPVEQYYRDVRIHAIHEGTTGIQAMDLLGRKVLMHDGRAIMYLVEEINQAIAAARKIPQLQSYAEQLAKAVEKTQQVTMHLIGIAQQQGPAYYLADATLYLELFGIVMIAWQWLKQGLAASKKLDAQLTKSDKAFYEGKLFTLQYFFGYELPKTAGLTDRLLNQDGLTVDLQSSHFND